MNFYFVGSKTTPEFLVELYKNNKIIIYKPDKYSKDEEFFEKYALGKVVFTEKNSEIIFTQNVVSTHKIYKYTPELIIRTNDKYILVNKNIKKLKTKYF